VVHKVVVVVVLGGPEGRGRAQLGDDRRIENLGAGQFVDHGLRGGALRVGLPEDGRFVLRADVFALTARGGRVVRGEKGAQQVGVGQYRGVEADLGDFDVAGLLAADLLVAGVFDVAAAVAGDDPGDTAQFFERGLGAPEAAGAEDGDFWSLVVIGWLHS